MNKKIFFSGLALSALMAMSCQRITPEIVDHGEIPAPKKPVGIDRTKIKRPPVDLLTQYLIFQDNNQKRDIVVITEGEKETVGDVKEVTVKITTSIPVENPFSAEVELMTEENAPKTYPDVIASGAKKIVPKELYSLSGNTVAFSAGDKEKTLTITFNKEAAKSLNVGTTYVLPLVLKVSDEVKKTLKLHNFFLLTVTRQNVVPLPVGDNVTVGSDLPTGLSVVNSSDIRLDTNDPNTKSHLSKLIDGVTDQYWQNWWVSDPKTTLDIHLAKKTKVKAIAFWTLEFTSNFYNTDKSLRKITVLASNDSGTTYALQGNVTLNQAQKIVVVTFPQTIEVNAIRLTGFEGNKYEKNPSGVVDLHEMRLYSE